MSTKTVTNLIKKTIEFVQDDYVHFTWHGGEPLLAGMNFYEHILRIQELYGKKKTIINGIQTNATLVSDRWASFFKKHDFRVGVSIDGPPMIQNAHRVLPSQGGSSRLVQQGLRALQRHDIYPPAIAVVTRESLGNARKIFQYFLRNHVRSIHIKECYEIDPSTGRPTALSVMPDEFTAFLIEIFDMWFDLDDPSISIRNLEQLVRGLVGGEPSLCEATGKCWLFPVVEADGTVGACDSFPIRDYHFGNINEMSWGDLFASAGNIRFSENIRQNEDRCRSCEWFSICHGCCLRHAHSPVTHEWHHNLFCTSKKRLFGHIKARIDAIHAGG
ncbi:hypothetical protein A2524_02825 [Candidatus Wolfebacteria bacterium RIFOXYD12_FULL_48_21]|nr:MAG: hypothetical protein A2524_02825 [Candidatus Wolfebacteria bacterium RIFOXYD12_FULL_48_21]